MTAELLDVVDAEIIPSVVTQPGRYPGMTEAEYHADAVPGGSLSSSVARALLPPSCPALAKHQHDNPEYKDAWDLGSVTHRLILGSGCEIVEVKLDSWATKAAREAKAEARARGAVALLSKDLRAAEAMRDAVRRRPLAAALLDLPGESEQCLFWLQDDLWHRAMLDRWADPDQQDIPICLDLKTTDSTADDAIDKTIYKYGYDQQADFYCDGYEAIHGVRPAFWFIFVEKRPPHLVREVDLDDNALRRGQLRNQAARGVWRECRRTEIWPDRPEGPYLAGLPRWARYEEDL